MVRMMTVGTIGTLITGGTKWEISGVECDHYEDNAFECEFETAWSPAEGIFNALRDQFPDLSISWFYDEPGMEFAGYLPN